ncbi:RNHCP domain-containing protein [Williamsia sp.]|uniref:RNHCP domain-containing protein n=1 Tax=Williamsia sp. TaxID=1872085 RepID=UPI0039C9AB83
MPDPRFSRRVEDFDCERCGEHVVGNGYTNHCPSCLWSKHVDVNPGDRAAECLGQMAPIEILANSRGWKIVHECQRCGAIRRVKSVEADSVDSLADVMSGASLRASPTSQGSRGGQ